MTKYEFMQDMLLKYRNRHRKELGLCPEQPEAAPCPSEPRLCPDGQAEGIGKPFDETPDNSTGIGGDCSNCGRENVPVYSHTTKDETQTVDVCQDCLRRLP